MFDIGWQEIFIVGVLAIIVVGPKDIPRVMRTVVLWLRKARGMARSVQSGIDDMVNEAGLEDIRADAQKAAAIKFEQEIKNAVDPDGELSESMDLPVNKDADDKKIKANG